MFDGSGGFPLAGAMNGVRPVWASEIEPYPLRVTAARFPQMKQLGDVTKIDGTQIEPVNIITFGSPCQDLSVAGKQVGIHEGERSNLFFEAIRIIKEMRQKTNGEYPRFALWENVPGAFSSGKGEDFRAVLAQFVEIGEGKPVSISRPKKWSNAGCIVGNGYSVAWRVYDAQYWGVPQRRKRIYLIADFGGERAGEILFERTSGAGNNQQGEEAWKGTAVNFEGSVGGSGGVKCLNPWDSQTIRQYETSGVFPTLQANSNGGQNRQGICYLSSFMGGQGAKAGGIGYCDDGTTPTLKAAPSGGNTVPDVAYSSKLVFNESGHGYWMPWFGCLRAEGENRPSRPNHVVVCVDGQNCIADSSMNLFDNHPQDARYNGPLDVTPTVSAYYGTGGNNQPIVVEGALDE